MRRVVLVLDQRVIVRMRRVGRRRETVWASRVSGAYVLSTVRESLHHLWQQIQSVVEQFVPLDEKLLEHSR